MGVRLVALVPILGLLLSGCKGSSSGGEPLPQPPPFSAGPTPTPSAVAIEVPPSARATSAVGAAQFARLYLEVLNQANSSGDVARLKAASHPDCDACRDLISTIVSEEADGKRFSGGEYVVAFAEATEMRPDDALVDVVYAQSASVTRDTSGKQLDASPAVGRGALQLRVQRSADSWRTLGMRFLDVAK